MSNDFANNVKGNEPLDDWEPANFATVYVKPSQMKVGDFVEGVFTETQTDEKYDTLKHFLRQDDGSFKVINGSGQLNFIMSKIAPGTKIRVVFEGKKKLDSGKFKGTEANQWKVFTAKVFAQKVGEAIVSQMHEKSRQQNEMEDFID